MRKITVEKLKNYYPTMDWESEYSDSELEKLYYEVYRENKEESYRIIFENRRVDKKYEIYFSFLEESERKDYGNYLIKELQKQDEKEVENDIVQRIIVFSKYIKKDVDNFVKWLISYKKSGSIDQVIIKLKLEIDKCNNNEIKECLKEVLDELSKHAK